VQYQIEDLQETIDIKKEIGATDESLQEDIAKLELLKKSRDVFLNEYATFATQASQDMLGDVKLEEDAKNVLASVFSLIFDGDKIVKDIEEEGTGFFGLTSHLKDTGLITTLKDAQEKYREVFATFIIPKDIEKDADALINAVATEKVRQ